MAEEELPPLDEPTDEGGEPEEEATAGKGRLCLSCGDPAPWPRWYCDKPECQEMRHAKAAAKGKRRAPSGTSRGGRPRATPTDKFGKLHAQLEAQFLIFGRMGMVTPAKVTACYVELKADNLAQDLVELAKRNKAVYEFLTTAADGGFILRGLFDVVGLGLALSVDMAGRDPHSVVGRAAGVEAAFGLMCERTGIEDPWPAVYRARQEAAQQARREAEAAAPTAA